MDQEAIKQMFAGAEQLPTLRGTLQHQQSTGAVWSGEWAMSEYEFYNGLKGQFEYKRAKKQVPMLAHKTENPEGVPADMYVNGYFTYQEGTRKSKINETNILLRFDDPEDGVSRVTGYGVNANGPFHMLGLYLLETQELRVERAYENHLDNSAAAAAAAGAAPTSAAATVDEPPIAAARPRRSKVGLSAEQQKLRDYIALMDKLKREDRSGLFLHPVDTAQWPDYVDIVRTPMDFGTIHAKLVQGDYSTIAQAQEDILLVFRNAQTYNAAGTYVFEEAKRLHLVFKREHDKQHKLWMKDDVLVVAEEQDKRTGSKRLSENDDDYMSDFEAPTAAVVSKSGRKSRPPAKLKKPSPVKTAASPTVTVDPAAAAAAAAKEAAMQEEIRLLKDRLRQLESAETVKVKPAGGSKKPRVVTDGGGEHHHGVVEPSPRRPAISRDDLPLTYQEQRVLAQLIFKLPAAKLAQLVKMLQDVSWHGNNEVEFNLAKQPVNVQRAINKYVKESSI